MNAPSKTPMISVAEAQEAIFALLSPTPEEEVPLTQARGRVLARDVMAARDQPPFAASAMDGYAVHTADVRPAATLSVIGETQAGASFSGKLSAGQAVRIFTGAPVPEGADRILIQEDVDRTDDQITLNDDLDPRPYIRPAGADFAAGSIRSAPRRLTPADIALLAAMNIPIVPVHRRPVVAIIPTGDELVMPGETPGATQIIASNTFGLKALLESAGAKVRLLPIARDTLASLGSVLELAAEGADLVVTIGGASVGDHDLVAQVAHAQGLHRSFYKVAMRPGKPLMAGRLGTATLVGLPGNPVSAMVCGHVFLRPALDVMQGLPAAALPLLYAPLGRDLPSNGPRAHYMRARLDMHEGQPRLLPHDRQDSALLGVLADADALALRPPHDPARKMGEMLGYIML